jgi:methionyl-tRNA synthetase
MGKDNIAFHTEIWPAELLGYAGDASKGGSLHRYGKLNLPTEIVSSEFLTMNGGKFSTSQNRVIYVKDFLEQFAADTLRYYIAISGPENQDTNFTWEEFFQRVNSELVGNWGNLVNRVLSIAFKKFDGIPQVKFDQLSEIDRATLDHVQAGFTSIGEKLSHSKMHASISEIMGLSDSVNQYLAKTQPWKETDTERVAQIIWTAAQCVADINVMLAPFLPFSCRAVYLQLGFKDGLFDVQPRIERVKDLDLLDEQPQPNYLIMTGNYRLGVNVPAWQHLPLKGGTMIPRPTPVFEKIDPQSVKL